LEAKEALLPNIEIWRFSFYSFLTSADWKPSKTLHFRIFGFSISLFGEISPVKSKGLSPTRLPRGSRFGGRVATSGMSCGERRGDSLLPDGRTGGRTDDKHDIGKR
jgi:hypothetical protein